MLMEYKDFIQEKKLKHESCGIHIDDTDINGILFPFQRDLVRWSLRKGNAAIFADTGLGKTFMQLEWARMIGKKVLIVAPLSVAKQTIREALKLDILVDYARSMDDVKGMITITNYEMIDHFEAAHFDGVVLDESSILKGLASKTRQKLIDMFKDTDYRLCCTATPAPNDIAEIANHSEFLGIMPRVEMLATFFVHDQDGWRLKGHAEQPFFKWMASWGMSIRKPSDLGYSDEGYDLPGLNINPIYVKSDYVPDGQLIYTGLKGITSRSDVRKKTIISKVDALAELINDSDDQWLVWCGLNDESKAMLAVLNDAVEVKGDDKIDHKIDTIESFQRGDLKVLITKPKIAGFGMNFQNCHNMAFIGLSDSWESYYQCIRREYRFGQEHEVNVYIALADIEDAIFANVIAKEKESTRMAQMLVENIKEFIREEMSELESEVEYESKTTTGTGWTAINGDSAEELKTLDDNSIDFSVYSPPFASLYTYSPTERDLGNSKSNDEFFNHYQYIIKDILRVTKPGRNTAVHTADIPAMLVRDGYIGLKDFPGDCIRAYESAGWIYHGRVTIEKNPQAQAIRTHSKALLFAQLKKDSSWSRPALGDYVLIFRKPGDNEVAIDPVGNGEIDNETWIKWASPVWTGIRESDTLQYTTARDTCDERHICPLQLETIERCIKLWSNPGETILTPFGGIGSEGYQAVKFKRKAVVIELKPSYYKQAVKNLREVEATNQDMFQSAGMVL